LSLSPMDFKALPEETIVKLKKAVAALEIDVVSVVIEEIRGQDPPLADGLKRLVEGYRFDKLQKLLAPKEEE